MLDFTPHGIYTVAYVHIITYRVYVWGFRFGVRIMTKFPYSAFLRTSLHHSAMHNYNSHAVR